MSPQEEMTTQEESSSSVVGLEQPKQYEEETANLKDEQQEEAVPVVATSSGETNENVTVDDTTEETSTVVNSSAVEEEETTTEHVNVETTESSDTSDNVLDPWAAYSNVETITTTMTTTTTNDEDDSTPHHKEEEETATNDNDEPPKQLTFGSRFENFKSRFTARRFQEEQAAATATTTTATTTAAEVPSANTDAGYQVLRASKISVTVVKETMDSKWGFGIGRGDDNDSVVIQKMTGHGLLEKSPFQEGDVLKTVNNQKCTDEEVTIQLLVKYEGGTPITLVVESPMGDPRLVQAMVIKPSPESKIGIGFYNTESANQTLLQINHIVPTGLLAHSTLSQGDLVLAINSTPCSHMNADDAAALIANSDSDTITVVAMRPRFGQGQPNRAQQFLRHAKRGAIALGGGTLVGVGLIFIPTLPPPFGEVLIIGGVSMLGTEFEAPKRVMKSARDSLERAVGRDADQGNTSSASASVSDQQEPQTNDKETADNKEEEAITTTKEETTPTAALQEDVAATATSSDAVEQPQPPKRTMGERFRNFGRIHVLPFLDQVVGDRNEPEPAPEEPAPPKDVTPEETVNEQEQPSTITITLQEEAAPPPQVETKSQDATPEETVNEQEQPCTSTLQPAVVVQELQESSLD